MRLTRDRVPPAIAGTRPSWAEPGDEPLAWGPFAADYANDRHRCGIALRIDPPGEEAPFGVVRFTQEWEIEHVLTRDPYVAEGKIFLRTRDGRVTLRPLRAGDRGWLIGPDGESLRGMTGDVAAAVRLLLRW